MSKTRKLIEAINIFSNRNSIYVTYKLFDTNVNTANMPFELAGFIENQKTFHEGALKSLNIQWREYLVTEVADVIRCPNFPLAISSIDDYKRSGRNNLQRFLQRLDLMYRQAVQDLTKFNVNDWLHFLRKFVMPENLEDSESEIWTISPNP